MTEIRTDYIDQETIEASDFDKAFKSIKGSVPGTQLHRYNVTPAYVPASSPSSFVTTGEPFRSGTSQLYYGGERLVKDVHYTEDVITNPLATTITFIPPHPGASQTNPNLSGAEIRMDFVWNDNP